MPTLKRLMVFNLALLCLIAMIGRSATHIESPKSYEALLAMVLERLGLPQSSDDIKSVTTAGSFDQHRRNAKQMNGEFSAVAVQSNANNMLGFGAYEVMASPNALLGSSKMRLQPNGENSFELSATNMLAAEIEEFNSAIAVKVPAEVEVWRVYRMEDGQPVDMDFVYVREEAAAFVRVDKPGHYQVLVEGQAAAGLEEETCESLGTGQQAPLGMVQAFIDACERVGLAATGEPIFYVEREAGTYIQQFTNGVLLYNPNTGGVYFVPTAFYELFLDSSSWLGYPRSDVMAGAPDSSYRDESSDFSMGGFMLTDAGFIGQNAGNGGALEAHLPFPWVYEAAIKVKVVVIGQQPNPAYDRDDPDSDEPEFIDMLGAQLEFDFDLETWAGGYGSGAGSGLSVLAEGFSYGMSALHPTTFKVAGPEHPGYERGFPLGSTIDMWFYGVRLGPDERLYGYMPCDGYEFNDTMPVTLPETLEDGDVLVVPNPCEGGGPGGSQPPRDTTPPTIELTSVYATESRSGQPNSLAIQGIIADDRQVAQVTITGNGETKTMTPYDVQAGGNGIYEGIFENVAMNKPFPFTIEAVDASGNRATASYSYFNGQMTLLGMSYCFRIGCNDGRAYVGSAGNPVLTSGGKVEVFNLLEVFGPGAAAIRLPITYNSQNSLPGVFGASFSSPLDARLALFDNSLFVGARVTAPDGHTSDFAQLGDCQFSPASPDVYDTLECLEGGYRLTTVYGEVYDYDADGRLVRIGDRWGNHVDLVYDGEQVVRLMSDTGREALLEYNSDGFVVKVSSAGRVLNLSYTGARLDSFTDGDGGAWTLRYEERPLGESVTSTGEVVDLTWYLLTEVVTPEGRTKNYQEYDDQGRVTMQRIGEEEVRRFLYSDEPDGSRTTTIIDANNFQEVHRYDPEGRLVSKTDALGQTEYFRYTGFIQTGYTDKNGMNWTYTADTRGNRLTADGPQGYHEEWSYNQLNLVIRHLDTLGRVTLFEYDERGALTRVALPTGHAQTFVNNERGLPVTVTDFSGRTTRIEYNAAGDPIKIIDGAGSVTTQTFDDLGRLVRIDLPRTGTFITYIYNGRDLVVKVERPLGWTTLREYDKDGKLLRETTPEGESRTNEYDGSGRLVEACDELARCTHYRHEAMGHVVGEEDVLNRETTYKRDPLYRIVEMRGPMGTVWAFTYDGMNNLLTSTDPLETVTAYSYNELYHLVKQVENFQPGEPADADTNVTTTYRTDLLGNVLEQTDAEGHSTFFTYNALNQRVKVEDALHHIWQYQYLPTGEPTAVTDARGFTFRMEYDGAGRLARQVDALGFATLFAHDTNGNLQALTDARGVVTRFEYDLLDRQVTQIQNYRLGSPVDGQTNVTTHTEYSLNGWVVSVTDPRGSVTTMEYDAAGQLIHLVDRTEAHTFFFYDDAGRPVGMLDPNEHLWGTIYNDLDQAVETIDPENHRQTMQYDLVGNLLERTNARGFSETMIYDGMYRVAEERDFNGGIWKYEYSPMGNLLALTDANGHAWQRQYDAVYNLTATIDPTGIVRSYEYDANSNPTRYVDGNLQPTRYDYDPLNRQSRSIDALNRETRLVYDPVGNLSRSIAPDGVVTAFGHDPLNRLASVTENYLEDTSPGSSINVTTGYLYDPNGNLVVVVDPNGNTTRYEYDPEDRLIREVDALGNNWQRAYDKAGNLIRRVDANGATTRYTYYPDNMLRSTDYPDAAQLLFDYDPNNNLTRMQELGRPLGPTSWTYDALDRITGVTDGLGRELSIGYDAVGSRTSLTYPNGQTVSYRYQPNNWLAEVEIPGQGVTRYTRNNEGYATRIENPNDTMVDLGYDAVNQVLNIRSYEVEHNRTLSAMSYTYDLAGQRTQVRAEYGWRQPAVVTTSYRYDPLRRLTFSFADGIQINYRYDAVGNRLEWVTTDDPSTQTPRDGFTEKYDYNAANQLVQDERSYTRRPGETGANPNSYVATFKYDANGSRIESFYTYGNNQQRGTVYSYDYEQRLVGTRDFRVSGPKATRSYYNLNTYTYDGQGARLVSTNSQNSQSNVFTTEYLNDGWDNIGVYDPQNEQETYFYRAADSQQLISSEHLWIAGAGADMWFYHDALGDVTGLARFDGQSAHTYRYGDFGTVLPRTGNFLDPHNTFATTGKPYDPNTGLTFFGARWYDSATARWMSRDPFPGVQEVPQSLHRYAYVHNNPINYIDEDGYIAPAVFIGLVILFTGVGLAGGMANPSPVGEESTPCPECPIVGAIKWQASAGLIVAGTYIAGPTTLLVAGASGTGEAIMNPDADVNSVVYNAGGGALSSFIVPAKIAKAYPFISGMVGSGTSSLYSQGLTNGEIDGYQFAMDTIAGGASNYAFSVINGKLIARPIGRPTNNLAFSTTAKNLVWNPMTRSWVEYGAIPVASEFGSRWFSGALLNDPYAGGMCTPYGYWTPQLGYYRIVGNSSYPTPGPAPTPTHQP